ncbi:MAG: hypothetical protein K5872_18200 [Rhizobiaceae bacterium]|nr:hypothetical protein [Rhizobiaceae bacterium]MCV0408157.1 hypothetical protein [Rhizobiaceae bacterium]
MFGAKAARAAVMCLLLAAVAAFLAVYDPHDPPEGAVRLDRVEEVTFVAEDTGAVVARMDDVTLPQDWRIDVPVSDEAPLGLVEGHYRLAFRPPGDMTEPLALLIPRVARTVAVSLNGVPFFDQNDLSADTRWAWYDPTLVPVPKGLLAPDENRLDIVVFGSFRSTAGLSRLILGERKAVERLYRRLSFLQKPLPIFANLASLVMAVPLFLIWLHGRGARGGPFGAYGILAAAVAIYSVRSMHVYVGEAPLPMSVWLPLVSASLGWAASLFSVFLLRFVNASSPVVERGIAIFIVAGTALQFGFPDGPFMQARTLYWYVPVMLLGTSCVAVFCYRTLVEPDRDRVVVALSLLLLVPAPVHDLLWLRGFLPFGSLLWLPLVVPAVLLAVSTVSANRFARDWVAADALNRNLTRRVREAEEEIRSSYEARLEAERREATAEERSSLIEDLHDGVGNRLSILLATLQTRTIPKAQSIRSLRESLNDLRMVITARDTGTLGDGLGELSALQSGLLETGGIELVTEIEPRAAALRLGPRRLLNLLRIAQEAISNAARHGAAGTIGLTCRLRDGDRLVIEVQDDGGKEKGAAGDAALSSGRGLSTMRSRALRLGGELAVEPSRDGWRVRLDIPVRDMDERPAASSRHGPASTTSTGRDRSQPEAAPAALRSGGSGLGL